MFDMKSNAAVLLLVNSSIFDDVTKVASKNCVKHGIDITANCFID